MIISAAVANKLAGIGIEKALPVDPGDTWIFLTMAADLSGWFRVTGEYGHLFAQSKYLQCVGVYKT